MKDKKLEKTLKELEDMREDEITREIFNETHKKYAGVIGQVMKIRLLLELYYDVKLPEHLWSDLLNEITKLEPNL